MNFFAIKYLFVLNYITTRLSNRPWHILPACYIINTNFFRNIPISKPEILFGLFFSQKQQFKETWQEPILFLT